MKHRRRSSSSSSHRSHDSLLPQGLCYSRYQRARKVVRHVSLEPSRSKSRDKYDAIFDRLGAMADQEDRKTGGVAKAEQFLVCALRGVVVTRLIYAPELTAMN